MGFPRYFDRVALSAASIVRGFDYTAFKEELNATSVAIAFDEGACKSQSSRWTLELLVNLLARLYPCLVLYPHGNAPVVEAMAATLRDIAGSINPQIDVVEAHAVCDGSEVRATVVVGATTTDEKFGEHTIHVGSRGWDALVGGDAPWGAAERSTPFAAGAASCFAAAAVFRRVFLSERPDARAATRQTFDDPISLSLIDLTVSGVHAPLAACDVPLPSLIDIGETFLVGVGAIGNGAAWAFARTPNLAGTLTLIDGERVDVTNIQRYVLTADSSEGAAKVDVAAREIAELQRTTSRLVTRSVSMDWQDFVGERRDYRFDRVLLALDSAEDRIAAQASLPRSVINAWTQTENLGISRHPNFVTNACVSCLYMPTGPARSHEELVAEALLAATPEERTEIKTLLHRKNPIGEGGVRKIAARLNIDAEPLLRFADRDLDAFFVEAVCGGLVLSLGADVGLPRQAIVPMAFQSALAGILLASETVLSAVGLRPLGFAGRSEIDLRKPLTGHVNSPTAKHPSGRCICQDDTYLHAYTAKYQAE